MIAALGIALQLAAATPALVIRDRDRVVRIPTVASADGPMVRPESLGPTLPIEIHRIAGTAYALDVWGVRLQLEPGVAMVRIGDDVRPLASAPRMQDGHLLVPLQLVSEVFPEVVPNTRWDSEAKQLVLFGTQTPGGTRSLAAARDDGGSDPTPTRRPVSAAAAARSDDSRLPSVPPKRHRYTIIVDAGHGGVDNGMTGPLGGGPKIYEKNVTLAVALKLGDQLESRGVDVVYTRTSDTLIALDDRGKIANRAAGSLFISVHVNAANPNWKDPRGSRGFETYFLSEARTEDARRVEQMENDAVKFETAQDKIDKDDPLSFILSDMQQNMHLRESSDLADVIQRRLGTMHPGPSRGVKQAGFRVLVTAYMPAVLVEIGFGTNPLEAAFISDPAKQNAIASAIADAAMQYLGRYEGRMKNGAGKGPSR
jgi:N-acetylmuramoyl-L-alanine amidase